MINLQAGDRVKIVDVQLSDAFYGVRHLLIGAEIIVGDIAVYHGNSCSQHGTFGGDFYFTPCSGGVFFMGNKLARESFNNNFEEFMAEGICFYSVKLELVSKEEGGSDGDQARDSGQDR